MVLIFNAGICAKVQGVQADQDEELLSAERVLTRAAYDMAAVPGLEREGDILGSSAHCERGMAELAEAAKEYAKVPSARSDVYTHCRGSGRSGKLTQSGGVS
jgi:hypothetical protein